MQLRPLFLLMLMLLMTVSCSRSVPGNPVAQAQSDEPAVPAQARSNEPVPPRQAPALQHPASPGYLPERLVIPAVDVDIPVVELGWRKGKADGGAVFSEWEVAEYAAGWHKNSALLDDGSINGGNVVMSGHNNVLGAVFRELDQLKRGDTLTVWSGNRTFEYAVEKVMIVPEKYATAAQRRANAAWIGSFDEQRLTLVSCWPRDDNTHRIIVIAKPAA
jgi:sortase A